jgi:hypothetical protein
MHSAFTPECENNTSPFEKGGKSIFKENFPLWKRGIEGDFSGR